MLPNITLAERNKDTPTHRLVVYDLRGAWTKSNRNVAFALFDTFMKTTVNIFQFLFVNYVLIINF